MGFTGPKGVKGAQLIDVEPDGNCCFRAFAASFLGNAEFEWFHAQFRNIAAGEITEKDEARGRKIRVDKVWAGSEALDALGKSFSAQVNIFRGREMTLGPVVGSVGAGRAENLYFQNGHWFGILGYIPRNRNPTNPEWSATHLKGGGARNRGRRRRLVPARQ